MHRRYVPALIPWILSPMFFVSESRSLGAHTIGALTSGGFIPGSSSLPGRGEGRILSTPSPDWRRPRTRLSAAMGALMATGGVAIRVSDWGTVTTLATVSDPYSPPCHPLSGRRDASSQPALGTRGRGRLSARRSPSHLPSLPGKGPALPPSAARPSRQAGVLKAPGVKEAEPAAGPFGPGGLRRPKHALTTPQARARTRWDSEHGAGSELVRSRYDSSERSGVLAIPRPA